MNEVFINSKRVENRLKELSSFGINKEGGIDRSIGSDSDVKARKYLVNILENELKAEVNIDPIANIWAQVKGSEDLQPITLGSHHDAVPNGGKFDGALGVLLAMEVAQRIIEENIKLRHPLQIVSFSAEEPNPFNISTLGSRVATGKISKEQVENAKNKDTGVLLSDVLNKIGGNVKNLEKTLLNKNDMSAFIECHIEQGRILYDRKESVGVVKKITGIYREEIRVMGEANHAGTTLMKYRHDSFLSSAEAALALEKIVKEINRNDVVGTVGRINVYPNAANIISGDTVFILEVRTPSSEIKNNIIDRFTLCLKDIEEKRNVKFERKVILNQSEVNMDEDIVNALKDSVKELTEPVIEMVSMAGHDSVHMCDITKTGMLFVQSIDGKSHCKEEKTEMKDIEKAGNVLLKAVLRLDKELN